MNLFHHARNIRFIRRRIIPRIFGAFLRHVILVVVLVVVVVLVDIVYEINIIPIVDVFSLFFFTSPGLERQLRVLALHPFEYGVVL